LVKVIRPTLQRGAHFVGVLGALINTSNAAAMSTVVVQDRLDMVGLHA
jgi:hypothetical protein